MKYIGQVNVTDSNVTQADITSNFSPAVDFGCYSIKQDLVEYQRYHLHCPGICQINNFNGFCYVYCDAVFSAVLWYIGMWYRLLESNIHACTL